MTKHLFTTLILFSVAFAYAYGQDESSAFRERVLETGVQSNGFEKTFTKPYHAINAHILKRSIRFDKINGTRSSLIVPKFEDGFFCKKERIAAKATKTPVKFRIGTFQDAKVFEQGMQ